LIIATQSPGKGELFEINQLAHWIMDPVFVRPVAQARNLFKIRGWFFKLLHEVPEGHLPLSPDHEIQRKLLVSGLFFQHECHTIATCGDEHSWIATPYKPGKVKQGVKLKDYKNGKIINFIHPPLTSIQKFVNKI